MSKYSPEMVEGITKAISDGLSIEDACELNGISKTTYYKWCKDSSKVDFVNALKRAELEGERERLKNIRRHAEKDWKSDAWYLERTKQSRYAIKNRMELTGKDGKEFTIKVEGLGNKDY